ncbi:MAG TPA: hypothetical protein VGM28_04315, partial [Candidatus Limnocylindrales bacterium]
NPARAPKKPMTEIRIGGLRMCGDSLHDQVVLSSDGWAFSVGRWSPSPMRRAGVRLAVSMP